MQEQCRETQVILVLLKKEQFQGIHMDPAKIESVKDWASPKSAMEIRQFLGLTGYYRRFIEGFSKITKPMTKLTQKKIKFDWCRSSDKAEKQAFQLIKQNLFEVSVHTRRSIRVPGQEATVLNDMGTRLDMEFGTFHRETDGQSDWTAYNSLYTNQRYHASIKAAPFEALYGQKCQSPVCWAEVGDARLTGPELVHETTEKIVQIKQRMQVSTLEGGHYVLEEKKRGKLNPRKCLSDEPLAVPLDEIHIDDKLHFVEEPVEILECEIKKLRRSHIPIIKVRWNSKRGPELKMGNAKSRFNEESIPQPLTKTQHPRKLVAS
ncbi:hypothetical protein Tco_0891250 [Tanacetum coccineum]|uniref:Reverse transcriptase domain-containing protein n=1 Tax=Tanacetum coccineum TaxID=301880 RepID=A0ABQ5C5L5_9ASTR